jgi:hypothetical protein
MNSLLIEMTEQISLECFEMPVMSTIDQRHTIRNGTVTTLHRLTSITSTSLSSGIGINDDNGSSLV